MSEQKFKIGITQGDPNGIGWEIIIKSLADSRMLETFTPVVYGSTKAASFYKKTIHGIEDLNFNIIVSAHEARKGKINIVSCGEVENIEPGKLTDAAGASSVEALKRCVEEYKAGLLDAIVTAPINKDAVQSDKFRFTGHTEFFGSEFNATPVMIMCSEVLRVALVTKHLPVSEISRNITREKIMSSLKIFKESLITDFGVVAPKIAVMALNPHAGDGGLLGSEEQEIIRPAIVDAYKEGILAFGPFAADGLFAGGGYTRYDGILAMYHDQGLAPFKTLSPDGVNFTAGLDAVRTSPDHGVAFDIAGQNKADAQSMRNAIYAAIDIVKRRKCWDEWSENPLQRAEREHSNRDYTPKESSNAEKE